jgi:hypothetical protein
MRLVVWLSLFVLIMSDGVGSAAQRRHYHLCATPTPSLCSPSIAMARRVAGPMDSSCTLPLFTLLSCLITSSFPTWSNLVCPHIQRNIRIFATLSSWICHLLVGQHPAPYDIAGLIVVMYNLPFNFCGTLFSHRTSDA